MFSYESGKKFAIFGVILSFLVVIGGVVLNIVLSAGGENNINPTLLLNAYGELHDYTVCRTMIYNDQMESFK